MQTKAWLGLALVLASCTIETTYVPRTPHTLALGIKNGEPALYKDGLLSKISSSPDVLVACSPSATADVGEAASRYASYRSNLMIASMFNALSIFAPPLIGGGIFFGARAADHQQQSYARVVDAVNRHNDEIGCVQR